MKYTIFDTPVVNPCTRVLAQLFLKLLGWKAQGERPTPRKYVMIAAPHTSNWDFPLMMAFAFLYRIPIHWMGKDSLFPGLIGPLAAYLGGIPIDRTKPGGMVEQTIESFNQNDDLVVAVPPEGTRRKTEAWKSGFYHIAHGAGVPVVPGFLDFGRKVGGFGPAVHLSGDIEEDFTQFRDFYCDITAKFPDKKSDIRILADK